MPHKKISTEQKEKITRLLFIKKYSPVRFREALKKGTLVLSAYEMNVLFPKNNKNKKDFA